MIIATGFFDGVHIGHKEVVSELVKTARKRNDKSTIITFWPHPRNVLQDDARNLRLLTSLSEKQDKLYELGVDYVEVLNFTKEFSLLSTEEYLKQDVIDKFGGTAILLGYDNRMGNNAGSPDDIAKIAHGLGLDVIRVGKIESSAFTVSSSLIREFLSIGQVEEASKMLGYKYFLHGVVVAGNQLGRTIGFPTANIQLYEPLKLVPANGVYLVNVETIGKVFYGMCNIGVRPTIGAGNARTIETHIFNFDEDIYGLDMKISFLKRIREERCFESMNELKQRLNEDKALCLALL